MSTAMLSEILEAERRKQAADPVHWYQLTAPDGSTRGDVLEVPRKRMCATQRSTHGRPTCTRKSSGRKSGKHGQSNAKTNSGLTRFSSRNGKP